MNISPVLRLLSMVLPLTVFASSDSAGSSLIRPVDVDEIEERSDAKEKTVGALVVGGEHPGLGVVRSLGRRGIPVVVIDDQQSISRFSKYTRKFVLVKDLLHERKAVDSILKTGKQLGLKNWILYPTRDETVSALSKHRDELSKFFQVPTPEWDTTKWAWDKKRTYELAEKLNIPCPRTFSVSSAQELPSLYSRLPLAIKPAVKENFFYATGAKAWRANTPEELDRLWVDAAKQIPTNEILIQEIIPGDGNTQLSYCAFFKDGTPFSVLLAKRCRQHPREFGRAATYVETIEAPEIEELSERFLKAINYYGLVEVEFKKDHRDGQVKLLDVNARTWGFHALGGPAGVDFPYLQYADALDLPMKRSRGKPGMGWLRLITDIPTASSDLLSGHLTWKTYWESIQNTQIESVFSADDLKPMIAELALLPYIVLKKNII